MRGRRLVPAIGLGLCVIVVGVVGRLVPTYYTGLMTEALILGIFAVSLDLLLGHTGLPSLGHSAYFGVSAYATAIVSLRLQQSSWVCALAGIAASLIIAAIYGLLALRTSGVYFMMITLALAQVLWGIAFGWRQLTGGDDGLPGVPRPDLGLPISLSSGLSFYYFVLVFFALAVAALWTIVSSPFGRALVGIRESERRMEVLGYNVWLHKYVAFVLAGLFAGLAGALFVYYTGFVSPAYLSIVFSAMALIMVILGGAGTLLGPALGSATIVTLENVISAYTQRWLLVLGLIYVAVTLFAPGGLVGLVRGRFGSRGA